MSLRPWWENASIQQKRALIGQHITKILVGSDKDAIRKVKINHGIDPDDKSNAAQYAWRKVDNKTARKTAARIRIIR